ncbi:phage tail spike protein [Lachnospiraceae bacterium 50-23]
MIQVYRSCNDNFDMNGDKTLVPTMCKVSAELNGAWSLELSHPIDQEGRWKYIEEEAVLAVPTFMGRKQLFRINKLVKTQKGVSATAYPIFFDSADDCFLLDTRPTMKNGQEALDIMMAGSKYSGESDISTGSTAYFERRNLMAAINGEETPTFISRWGGEILYDNYKIIVNKRVGGDYGSSVRYGKNMRSVEYNVDFSEVATRIVPLSYNGYTLDGADPWVDSPNIRKYAKIYTREMKFDNVKMREDAQQEDEENGIVVCDTKEDLDRALTEECKKQYGNGVDLPRVTVAVDMIDLSRTEEYKDFRELEIVSLGDTVHCYNVRLNIRTSARVIKMTWDCIRNRVDSLVLGDFKYNYFDELSHSLQAVQKIMGPGNTVVAERVQGVLNAINTQLRYQKNIAQRQDVRAILFEDTDQESPGYGALAIGTQGFQIASRRTEDGRDWDWTTAFTAKGGYADVLIAGILSDKTGKSFWNLDTGEMQLTGVFRQFASNGYKSVDIANNEIRFFDWNTNGNYVGSIGAAKRKNDGRVGVEMWCDNGDIVWIGYDDGSGKDDNIKPVFYFDSKTPDKTPWVINTASGNIFPAVGGGGIVVENGFIKSWNIDGAEGTIYLGGANGYKDTKVTVKDGLITSWSSM